MSSLRKVIISLLDKIESLVPSYFAIEEESIKANGCVAVCLIDGKGNIYGRIFGDDKILGRERYRVAWTKASQSWITGMKTGEFEKLVFNNEIDEKKFGIKRPDYIGWEGGQTIALPDGSVIAAGFSGFRGETDIEIVRQSVTELK
jgi:uncharacterized protein GlcG (DUF336 family)